MTCSLFRAFAGRLAVMAVSALVLGGLATQAGVTRPEPAGLRTFSMACFDPDTPERGWIVCSSEVAG